MENGQLESPNYPEDYVPNKAQYIYQNSKLLLYRSYQTYFTIKHTVAKKIIA